MCKSLHSGYCGNGNCCIIDINVIGILRTKLIYTYKFFLKLNTDLSKMFVVHSPQSLTSVPKPRAGCMKALFFRYCLQGFNAVTSADCQFSKDSLCFFYWLSAVKTFCMFGVQCLLLMLVGWGSHARSEGCREGAAEKINLSGTK